MGCGISFNLKVKGLDSSRIVFNFQTLSLFAGSHGHVALGAVSSAETLSFAVVGLLNKMVMTEETSNMFLLLFLTLAGFSLLGRAISKTCHM